MSKESQITMELLDWERKTNLVNDKKMFRAIGATFVAMFLIQWPFVFALALIGPAYLWWLFYKGRKVLKTSPMAEKSKEAKKRSADLKVAGEGFLSAYLGVARQMEYLEKSITGCETGKGWIVEDNDYYDLYSNYISTANAPAGDIQKAHATFADNTYVNHVAVANESETRFDYHRNPANNEHEIQNARTTINTSLRTMRGGSASVSIEGPKLVPGVILFNNARDAASFANAFNQQVAAYATSKTQFREKTKELRKSLKEAQDIASKIPMAEMEKFFNSVDRNCGYLVFGENYELLMMIFDPELAKKMFGED
jgi:hypothetical protein